MSFSLRNALPTFHRLIGTVMVRLQGTKLFIYLDYMIIFSDTPEVYGRKIEDAFTRLSNAGLIEKSDFQTQKVRYLGHKIS